MSEVGPDSITVVEVGPRDGLQNESRPIPAASKIELINRLHRAGLRAIEVGSFVRPDRIPQLADGAEVVAAAAGLPGLRSIALVPNEQGLVGALESKVSEVAIFGSASEAFSLRNINRTVSESLEMFEPVVAGAKGAGLRVRGYVSTVLGCPYQGEVPISDVARVVEAMFELGCDEVSLGDTIGVGAPGEVLGLVRSLAASVPVKQLAFHGHDTHHTGLANAFAAIEAGITTIDSSVAGLGGCPFAGPGAKGNLSTNTLVYALERSGISTGVDLDALDATADWIRSQI